MSKATKQHNQQYKIEKRATRKTGIWTSSLMETSNL